MVKLQAIGNLGKDATVNSVNGKTVINFSIAHSFKVKDEDKTQWIDAAYWTDKPNVAQYLLKGAKVFVEGLPDVRSYESKGEWKSSLSVRVLHLEIVKFAGGQENEKDLPF